MEDFSAEYCKFCGYDLTTDLERNRELTYCPNCGSRLENKINNEHVVEFIPENFYGPSQKAIDKETPTIELRRDNSDKNGGKGAKIAIIALSAVAVILVTIIATTAVMVNMTGDKKTAAADETTSSSQGSNSKKETNTKEPAMKEGEIFYVSDNTPQGNGLMLKTAPDGSSITTIDECEQVLLLDDYNPDNKGFVYVKYYDPYDQQSKKGWVEACHLVNRKPEKETTTIKAVVEKPTESAKTKKYKEQYYFYGYEKGKSVYNFEYVYPSDKELLTYTDLEKCSPETVQLIMNEMYAKHGWWFNETDRGREVRSFFQTKSWYSPYYTDQDECRHDGTWNSYETKNWQTIIDYQKKKGLRK